MGGVLLTSFSNLLNSKYSKQYEINFKDYFYLYDPFPGKKESFLKSGYKNYLDSEGEVLENSKIIFTCVKPDKIYDVLASSKINVQKETLIVSIAAGISIDYIEQIYLHNYLSEKYPSFQNQKNINSNISNNPQEQSIQNIPKIVRIMSNHLCSINEAGSVYSINKKCDLEDEELINFLLKNVGLVKKIDENLMNAYTALAGSGPAFVYHFIESLVDASIKLGIDVHTAREFAVQTVFGASKYVLNTSDKNPNNIQYIVTTPNGTTIAGLNQLNKNCFKYAVSEALTAAAVRGEEIEKSKLASLEKLKI